MADLTLGLAHPSVFSPPAIGFITLATSTCGLPGRHIEVGIILTRKLLAHAAKQHPRCCYQSSNLEFPRYKLPQTPSCYYLRCTVCPISMTIGSLSLRAVCFSFPPHYGTKHLTRSICDRSPMAALQQVYLISSSQLAAESRRQCWLPSLLGCDRAIMRCGADLHYVLPVTRISLPLGGWNEILQV